MEYVKGKKYRIFGRKGTIDCIFKGTIRYSFLPNDLIFEYVSGDRSLIDVSSMKATNEFPLPIGLVRKIRVEELED